VIGIIGIVAVYYFFGLAWTIVVIVIVAAVYLIINYWEDLAELIHGPEPNIDDFEDNDVGHILVREERTTKQKNIASKKTNVKNVEYVEDDYEEVVVKEEKPKKHKNQVNKKPGVKLDDIKGLDAAKEAINQRVILPILHPEVYSKYGKKAGGGILLYGLPGTGKTMFAQAVATELNAEFYEIKCSDIMS
jgi:SpoVK/Ycf46/Vps4 family AAA+-type ATPase